MELKDCITRGDLVRFVGGKSLDELHKLPINSLLSKALEVGVSADELGRRVGRIGDIIRRLARHPNPNPSDSFHDDVISALKTILNGAPAAQTKPRVM